MSESPTRTPGSTRKVRFAAFEVDLRSGELRKSGVRLKLQDQPFQILALLLERPGEIVTREELRKRLWPSDTFVDFDVGLNTAVKRLRDVLGDSAEGSRYVETLPRRGYRFIASVERIDDLSVHAERSPEQRTRLGAVLQPGKLWIALGLVAAIPALLLSLNISGFRQRFLRASAATKVHSVAVLPLENLTGDPGQDYFADGMTEAVITDLGKIGQLRVISRTSVMKYKGTKKSLREIADELQVDALVEGTVARSGDRVRVTANLVQASPEKHIWADSFERDIRNVLDLQDDVSRAIANGIQIKLTPQEQARLSNSHAVNPEAYEAYLEGRYFMETFYPRDSERMEEYFELAIKKDPAWALPYSGLAEVHALAGANLAIPNEECQRAKVLALESLSRDSATAESHTILADIEHFCAWNWLGAEQEVRRAIELNPNFARAHGSYGRYLLVMDRANEALAETKRAVELDPLAWRTRWDRWMVLFMLRRYDEAAEQCRKMQELNPNRDVGHIYCGDVYVEQGKLVEAIQELEKAVALSEGSTPRGLAHLGYAYAVAGRKNDAESMLGKLNELSNKQHVHPDLVAGVYAGLGQKEQAFEWLEKAYQVRARDLLELKYDPHFANLRSDPRFIELVRRIRLPP
jgi:TolB-like protein/DNA-binding winged helix-turn-helix (wHTH) protein/Flp pilus assembly protein TadD